MTKRHYSSSTNYWQLY